MAGAAQPKRKAKPMLTLIPEEERAINYRFTVVLVGEGARDFAQAAVDSDMAEAYKPKSSAQPAKVHVEEGAEEGPGKSHSGQEGREKKHEEGAGPNDKLALFCPTGPNTKELARLRLHPCVGFSDALPLQRDPAAAKNTIVALLFWQVPQGDLSATDSTITEWYSRMAEINHMPPSFRPYTVVLAFEADDDQEQRLNAFTEKQAGKVEPPKFIGDSGEDSIVESLQDIAEEAIARQREVEARPSDGDVPVQVQKGRCCTIL